MVHLDLPFYMTAVLGLGLVVVLTARCSRCGLFVCLRYNKGGGIFTYHYVSWPPSRCSRCGHEV